MLQRLPGVIYSLKGIDHYARRRQALADQQGQTFMIFKQQDTIHQKR
jgi:hypothetical protein